MVALKSAPHYLDLSSLNYEWIPRMKGAYRVFPNSKECIAILQTLQ
ncbi:hypothetical protein NPIL_467281, partial [Nephila pilipes]